MSRRAAKKLHKEMMKERDGTVALEAAGKRRRRRRGRGREGERRGEKGARKKSRSLPSKLT